MLKLRDGTYSSDIGNDLEKAIIDFLEKNREARLMLEFVYKKKKNRRKIKKHGKTI